MKKIVKTAFLLLCMTIFLVGCANPALSEKESSIPDKQIDKKMKLSLEDSSSSSLVSSSRSYSCSAFKPQWKTHDLYSNGSMKSGFTGVVIPPIFLLAGCYIHNTTGKELKYTIYTWNGYGWSYYSSSTAWQGRTFGASHGLGVKVTWEFAH